MKQTHVFFTDCMGCKSKTDFVCNHCGIDACYACLFECWECKWLICNRCRKEKTHCNPTERAWHYHLVNVYKGTISIGEVELLFNLNKAPKASKEVQEFRENVVRSSLLKADFMTQTPAQKKLFTDPNLLPFVCRALPSCKEMEESGNISLLSYFGVLLKERFFTETFCHIMILYEDRMNVFLVFSDFLKQFDDIHRIVNCGSTFKNGGCLIMCLRNLSWFDARKATRGLSRYRMSYVFTPDLNVEGIELLLDAGECGEGGKKGSFEDAIKYHMVQDNIEVLARLIERGGDINVVLESSHPIGANLLKYLQKTNPKLLEALPIGKILPQRDYVSTYLMLEYLLTFKYSIPLKFIESYRSQMVNAWKRQDFCFAALLSFGLVEGTTDNLSKKSLGFVTKEKLKTFMERNEVKCNIHTLPLMSQKKKSEILTFLKCLKRMENRIKTRIGKDLRMKLLDMIYSPSALVGSRMLSDFVGS